MLFANILFFSNKNAAIFAPRGWNLLVKIIAQLNHTHYFSLKRTLKVIMSNCKRYQEIHGEERTYKNICSDESCRVKLVVLAKLLYHHHHAKS